MKTTTLLLLLLSLTTYIPEAESAIITATTTNGNWASTTTWDLHRIPANGDVVKIPSGKTVQLNSDVYNNASSLPVLAIIISGTLDFECGGELNLKCGSSVCTSGSGEIPATGSSDNIIAFGNATPSWMGCHPSVSGGTCVTPPCPSSSLPVELLSFEAQYVNGTVQLTWATGSEINFDRFEIERSSDAVNFEILNTVKGASANAYIYLDQQPLQTTSYYRLKEVDKDNAASYSSVVVVQEQQSYSLSVYPNPSLGNNFQLKLPEANATTPVTIFLKDLMGKVLTETIIEKGKMLFSFEDIILPSAGIYIVELSVAHQRYSTRVSVE
jgi:hypothetical protein